MYALDERTPVRSGRKTGRYQPGPASGRGSEAGFTCLHCRGSVSPGWMLSGVRHRNHCPYCLWSRHLDWMEAGDRLSACKAGMQPVGLTLKRCLKKYGSGRGELMLVHRCTDCGTVSINRIAADDDPGTIFGIFEASSILDEAGKCCMEELGIDLLQPFERDLVHLRLFGNGAAMECAC